MALSREKLLGSLLFAAAVLLPGGAAVAGAVWLYRRRRLRKVSGPVGRVLARSRAKGLRPELAAFLDWWEKSGPFLVCPAAPEDFPGLRNDAQQALLFARGATQARTAAETAHGRGAAVDLYPVRRSAGAAVEEVWLPDNSQGEALFARMGALAEARGLVWGGRWHGFKDAPHVELLGWQKLPMPGGARVA